MALTKVSNDLLATPADTTGLETDIALLGFKVAANGSLAAYNLHDQTVDAFEDASGIDASASTGEVRNASNYYSGVSFGSYTTDAFTSTGASTWTCPSNTSEAEVLVVAGGGGGGGRYYGGGGGAGGIVHDTDYAVVSGTVYDITVGAGGGGGWIGTIGDTGSDSVFNVNAEGSGIALTAKGGGGGAGGAGAGGNGGSGGGGTANDSGSAGGTSNQATFSGATSYGNSGAAENGDGGGGGGASAAGSQGTGSGGVGGAGGAGQLFSNFTAYGTTSGNVASSGSDGGYFGGGGGGSGGGHPGGRGPAGVGGGGRGGAYNGGSHLEGDDGLANTGGGGGGTAYTTYQTGKDGGSGVVLVRHRSESYNDISLVSNSTTAESTPTNGDIVMTYTNGVGTATVNTDIKAWISRDNGTTYTQATLSSEGTTGGHTILTAHNVDISSQPSGTSMRYKITTHNQSASKETRIQAVSLGWS